MANTYADVAGPAVPIRGQLERQSSGAVTPPPAIIQSVAGARAIYNRFRANHLRRIELYARIEGLIAGNPPYDPNELKKSGLGHIANFNPLDARGFYEKSALAYWNLLNAAETLCKFTINLKGIDGTVKLDWEQSLARNWDCVVRKWPDFVTHVSTLSAQIIKFGISPALWADERDWRWRTIELSRFFVADQASTSVDQLTSVCVESNFTVQYLYQVYLEFKDKKDKSDWNIDELGSFLLDRANSNFKQDMQLFDPMDLQKHYQNRDIAWDAFFTDTVRLVSLLEVEYTEDNEKGVSHYIFDRWWSRGEGANNFLYKAVRQYRCMQDALVIFTASPGEFTIHSNRGVGHKIFSPCQAMMQNDCSLADAARWAASPLIQSPATGIKDIETIRFYPGAPINLGMAEFVQNQMGENLQPIIGVSQYLNQKMQYNIANAGDDPTVPDSSQGSISPSEAKARDFKEFSVLKHNVAHFYNLFDIVIRNMTIGLLKSKKGYPGYECAKEWKDRCLEDGVPEQIFETSDIYYDGMPKQLSVRATRVAGDGSTLAHIMGLEALGPAVAGFGAKGIKAYQKQLVMATMGTDYVDAFIGPEEPDESAGGASLAAVENAIMQLGKAPIVSPDNEQRSHIATHFALANQLIQARTQQQMGAREADQVFTVLIPHLGQHIQLIAQNPFEVQFFESVKKPWAQIEQYATLNRKNATAELEAQIKQQQEAQANTQEAMTDEQIKNMKAQGDERRADMKVQDQVARADKANQTRGQVMQRKAELDAANVRYKTTLEHQAKMSAKAQDQQPLPQLRKELSDITGNTPSPNDFEAQ